MRRTTNVNLPSLDDDHDEPGIFTMLLDLARKVPPLAWAAIAVVIALLLVFGGGDSDESANAVVINVPSATSTTQRSAQRAPEATRFERALQRAELAISENRLIVPADDNAVVHYAQAAALERDNQSVRGALEDTLQRVFAEIENDLLRDDLDGATAALSVLNSTVPGHPRLAFFNRQLTKEQVRRDLIRVEQAIADGDSVTASRSLARLRASGAVDAATLDTLESRLKAGTIGASLPELLQLANMRVGEGKLITPTNDSARFYYQAALQIEPDNEIARQGMTFVGSMLLADARTNAKDGNLGTARTLLDEAQASGANSIEVEALRRQIEQSARANTRSQPAAQAPPPRRQPATRTAATNRSNTPSSQRAAVPPPPTSVASNRQAPANEQSAVRPPPIEQRNATGSAGTNKPRAEEIVLKQVRTVPPRYPRGAQRRGLEGWVELEFVVLADGKTSDIEVVESSSGTVFDRAAIDAVEDWRYEPLSTTDPGVTKRVRIKLDFNFKE